MLNYNMFSKVLNKLDGKLKLAVVRVSDVRKSFNVGDMESAYEQAFRLVTTTENAVGLARALPAYTGNPNAERDVENVIRDTISVRAGFTEEGWFSLHIPLLLPKKSEGSADYIRSFLYPALRDFFMPRQPIRYTDCVIIYRHVYDRQRPERQKRDHDNIEINMVSDIVAMYTMTDDGPSVCSHYYCSAAGNHERTEVYVVPKCDFQKWLKLEPEIPEEGIKLHETPF